MSKRKSKAEDLSMKEMSVLLKALEVQQRQDESTHCLPNKSPEEGVVLMKSEKNPAKRKKKGAAIGSKVKALQKELKIVQDQLNESTSLPEIRGLVTRADKLMRDSEDGGVVAPSDLYFQGHLNGDGISHDYILSAAGKYPSLVYQLSIQPLRKKFIEEYKIKTVPEHMLLDRIMFAYFRATQLDSWINSIFGKGSVERFGMELYRVLEDAKEKVERQLVRNLEALKRLKMPPLNLNIRRADNVNVADKQQVNISQGSGGPTSGSKGTPNSQLITEGQDKCDETS
jgi:hypothetical protein